MFWNEGGYAVGDRLALDEQLAQFDFPTNYEA